MAAKPTGVVVVVGLIPRLTTICKFSLTGSYSLVSMGSVHLENTDIHASKALIHLKKERQKDTKERGEKERQIKLKKKEYRVV